MSARRIALVGNGTTTRASDGFDGEIWTTASVAKILPKVDRVFEVHAAIDAAILAGYKCPVMMDGARPANVPLSEDLRIDSLVSKYGPMFQFSYDYMAAFALESGVKDITLYGIDLATEEEYAKKRLSFYYWIGMLRGSGATVNVSAGSLILSRRWVYCHERDVLSDAGARLEKLADDKLAEWQAKEDEARLAVAFSNGYKQCAQDMTRIGE
jgi:hypothetical protein